MKKRILICDDDAEILLICTHILEKQGYQVHTSQHCNEIVELVKRISPDVILMDNMIPNAGGIVASRSIKGHKEVGHIPVIYFSASDDVKELALQAGADAFLPKPFDLSQLEKVIADVLKK